MTPQDRFLLDMKIDDLEHEIRNMIENDRSGSFEDIRRMVSKLNALFAQRQRIVNLLPTEVA